MTILARGATLAACSIFVTAGCGAVDELQQPLRTVVAPLHIVTVAGTDVDLGDGRPATAALLTLPAGLAFDGAGNAYIADGGSHRVRKVDATGIISTFAGLGGSGSNGDHLPATAAQLNTPRGTAIDAAGHLFVSENGGNRVRRIDRATGVITTVAGTGATPAPGGATSGGAATATPIAGPGFLAFDAGGILYFTEVTGQRVRKVVPGADGVIDGAADELITTVAGSGAACPPVVAGLPPPACGDGGPAIDARLSNPNGIALDAAGNLYLADVNDNRVRYVNLGESPTTVAGVEVAPGAIVSVAGTGFTGYDDDVAADVAAASAKLFSPRTVTVGPDGHVYVADFNNNRVRVVNVGTVAATVVGKVVAPGRIVTIVNVGGKRPVDGEGIGDGGPAAAAVLNGPNSVSFDRAGNMYVAESLGQRVRRVDPTGTITTFAGGGVIANGDGGPAIAAQLGPSGAVAVDGAGNLLVADLAANRIRRVERATGAITTVAGTGTAGSTGDGLAASAARLNGPAAIAFDAGGSLYVADSTGRRIRRIVPGANGVIDGAADDLMSTVAGTGLVTGPVGDGGAATAARLNNPQGLAFDAAGHLFVTEFAGFTVREISPGADGVIDGDGDDLVTTVVAPGRLGAPQGVAIGDGGQIFVADGGTHRVWSVDRSATPAAIAPFAGTGEPGFDGDLVPATSAKLNTPQSVAVAPGGGLAIADAGNNRVRSVDASGTIATVAGSGAAGFGGDGGAALAARLNGPRGIAFDAAGNGYVTDSANGRVRRLNLGVEVRFLEAWSFARWKPPWVTAVVVLPAGVSAADVSVASVTLQATDPTNGSRRQSANGELLEARPLLPGIADRWDSDGDGVRDRLLFRFRRAAVTSWATGGPAVAVRLEGQLRPPAGAAVGRYFSGDGVVFR